MLLVVTFLKSSLPPMVKALSLKFVIGSLKSIQFANLRLLTTIYLLKFKLN